MPLSELGAYLQRHREEQDLSLDELEQITRIRRRYLEAIEAGDWDALPPSVYTRGLLRNYARALGLSTNRVLRMYVKERPGEARLPEPQLISRPLIEQPRFNLELLLAIVLMIAAAGLFGWIIMTQLPDMLPQIQGASQEASASAPAGLPDRQTADATPGSGDESDGDRSDGDEAASQSDASSADGAEASGTAREAAGADDEPRATRTPKASASDSSRSGSGDTDEAEAGEDSARDEGDDDADGSGASGRSAAATPSRRSTTVAPMATATRRASPTPDGLVLLVKASSDTWIRVYTDGEEAYASFLYEGDSMTWRADESVRLRTGNAGGTEITINGQRIDQLGDGGSVEEREWRLLPNGDIEQREV